MSGKIWPMISFQTTVQLHEHIQRPRGRKESSGKSSSEAHWGEGQGTFLTPKNVENRGGPGTNAVGKGLRSKKDTGAGEKLQLGQTYTIGSRGL